MRIETLDTVMTKNPNFISGAGDIEITPRYVGVIKDAAGKVRGAVVWWSRYRMDGVERVQTLNPRIGVQLDGERMMLDVVINEDRKTMSGRVRTRDGYEVLVSLEPKKDRRRSPGDQRVISALIRIGGVWQETFDDVTMPEDYFFPDPD